MTKEIIPHRSVICIRIFIMFNILQNPTKRYRRTFRLLHTTPHLATIPKPVPHKSTTPTPLPFA